MRAILTYTGIATYLLGVGMMLYGVASVLHIFFKLLGL